MQRLVRGVHKFQKDVVGKKADFFADLAKGQRPHTLFISCSDSRLSPNQLTQTEPGEIFILRNAGNIIPPHSATVGGEAATIETGEVFAYDPVESQFLALAQYHPQPPQPHGFTTLPSI